METLRKKLSKKFGYNVSNWEIVNDYRNGFLILTDKEENAILEYLENN